MEQKENSIDFHFMHMALNNAIASLKNVAEEAGADVCQLEIQGALTSLFIARKWIVRAEERTKRG